MIKKILIVLFLVFLVTTVSAQTRVAIVNIQGISDCESESVTDFFRDNLFGDFQIVNLKEVMGTKQIPSSIFDAKKLEDVADLVIFTIVEAEKERKFGIKIGEKRFLGRYSTEIKISSHIVDISGDDCVSSLEEKRFTDRFWRWSTDETCLDIFQKEIKQFAENLSSKITNFSFNKTEITTVNPYELEDIAVINSDIPVGTHLNIYRLLNEVPIPIGRAVVISNKVISIIWKDKPVKKGDIVFP